MSVGANRILAGTTASVVVIGLALAASESTASGSLSPAPSVRRPAQASSPALQPYERQAAACPGLDPLILAAIHDVETHRDATGATSAAGAVGPMQFLPETWAAYGVDGDGDGRANPWDIEDALAGATKLLCADGVADPAQRASAIWNYNHSWDYVDSVLRRAAQLREQFA